MASRRGCDLVWRGILLLPARLAIRRINRKQNFVIALAREIVDGARCHYGRRVPEPDLDLPLQLESGGPRLGLHVALPLAMRSAPFRPIGRGEENTRNQ